MSIACLKANTLDFKGAGVLITFMRRELHACKLLTVWISSVDKRFVVFSNYSKGHFTASVEM